jgi:phage terminase large subunit-like protein
MLAGGAPVDYPTICDGVFAVIDTAIKDSKESDGTGVVFFAKSHEGLGEYQLVVLDWDIEHIKGAVLEEWLPSVYERLEQLARQCRARFGSLGVWIEDKVSGTILLQQAEQRGWDANAIDSVLTSVGKSARAISVSGYYWRGMVKITGPAYDKQTLFKGITRNHFVGQVVGFSPGEKDARAQDDLLDAFVYGISIALGDGAGI